LHIDRSRLFRLLLAGAFAGFVIFCLFNPGVVKEEVDFYKFGPSEADRDPAAVLLAMTVFGAAFAAMIGGMLALADEVYSPPKRIAIRMGIAVGVGLVIGAIAGLISQMVFGILVATSTLLVIPARVVSWATFGFGAGAGLGAALGSWRRAGMCMLGGAVGGCIAGGLFDMICAATGAAAALAHPGEPPTGSLGRFIGFVLMGITVAVTVAFVEDIAKQSWVTVLSGPKEGRSYILSKPTTTIGRDELADIPLFGDMTVAKQHAVLHMQGNVVALQGVGGPVAVNGAVVQAAVLRPWDTFCVGRWSLRFHQKGVQRGAFQDFNSAQPPKNPSYPSPAVARPAYAPSQVTISQPVVRTAAGNLSLLAAAGPHLNQRFSFEPGTVRIGREAGCAVLLTSDPMVSRNHAELRWNGSSWIVRDLGSRNGLWVNGVRVTEHTLNIGDQIGVGQTLLRVEGL